jgi:hypothetical protein
MKWKKERDLLIAQTMAFAQSVAGKAMDAKATDAEGRLEPVQLDEPAELERLVEALPIVRPSPARYSELREEIRGRVAAFRAHQELFHRNRDEYCNSMLAKVRAATERPSEAADNQPVKR